MVKKRNHKVFNLIIMICISIYLIGILNISYAQETTIIYGQEEEIETDYVPEDKDDKAITENDTNVLWLRENNNDMFQEVRKNVAQWYYIFRYLCIAIMLVILIGLGIKLAISSAAEQKATYKRMLLDWVVCFILLFMVHYFMIFVQFLNERLIYIFQKVSEGMHTNGEYSLYETVRSRAYDMKLSVGFTGMILYMMLVWLTGKYILIYAKRFITMVILTIMAPIMVLFYGIQKIFTGRSQALSKWMGEYMTNTLMQAVHAMTYAVFIGLALKLSQESLVGVILSFLFINFMGKADTMFRNIFKFSDGSTVAEEIAQSKLSDLKDNAMTAVGVAVAAKQLKDSRKNTVNYNKGLGRDILNSTKIGEKLVNFGDNVRNLPGSASLLLASKVKNGIFGDNSDESAAKQDEKNNAFNQRIAELDSNINKLQNHLAAKGSSMKPEEKAKFENQLRNLQKERFKTAKKQGNYNARMGIFQRAKDVLDPDTYLEYATDPKTGEFIKDKNGNLKRRMARKQVLYDAETDTYKRVGGVRGKFQDAKDAVFGFSDDDKKVLKAMTQVVKDGTIGAGAMMLGMASFAENPTLGMALLATGVGKTRKFNHVDDNGLKISRRDKRKIAKYMAKQDEKKRYTNAQFNSGTILNMDEIIREITSMDPSVQGINRIVNLIQSGKLKFAIPMLPFTLTGTKGGVLNLLYSARAVAAQHEKNMREYLISVNVEYTKKLTEEILEDCETVCKNITTYMMQKDCARLLTERQLKNGSLFLANGKLFGFADSETQGTLTTEEKIKQAIMQTALAKNIYNFDRFDLDKKGIRDELLKNLIDQGVITDKNISTEYLINRLLDGSSGKITVKTVLNDLTTNSPDLLKTKLFQSCVEEYAQVNKIKSIDDLLSDAAQKAITSSYRNKLYFDHTGAEIQAGIIQLAASSGKKISDLTSAEIMTALQGSNQSALTSLEETLKAKTSGNTVEQEIEIKQKQIDSLLTDMVLGVLANNNVTNPSDVDLSLPTDAKMQSIKADLLATFGFAFKDAKGVQISEEVLTQILQSKIATVSKEDIEKTIIDDVCAKFVSEECGGDISKLNDPKVKEELQKRTIEKLKGIAETQEERDNYEDVLNLLKGIKNSSDSDEEKDKNRFFSFDDSNDSSDPDEVGNFPLPAVTAKFIDNKVFCTFEIPAGAQDFTIEACKKTKSATRENFVENMETVILENEDEIACARLVKGGKHGQSLVVKYPVDAMKIASKLGKDIDKAEKDEEKRRDKAKTKSVEKIALNVFDSLKEFDENAEPEDVLGQEQMDALLSSDTELAFREAEIRSATSRVLNVADMLRSKKVRMNNEDDKQKVLDMVNDALFETEELIGMNFGYDNIDGYEDYRKSTDALINKLLQIKMIDDDNEKLKIKSVPDKNKAYKKSKQQLEEGIENIDVNQIIRMWKEEN